MDDSRTAYVCDDEYLWKHLAHGNLHVDWWEVTGMRHYFIEHRLCYQLFALKNPELPYITNDISMVMKQTNKLFSNDDFKFQVAKENVNYADFDISFLQTAIPFSKRPKGGNGILIATSLAPNNLDIQKKALDTWFSQGCDVISVNYQWEIEILRSHFPKVTFVRNIRDSQSAIGRPLVYLDDIWRALNMYAPNYEIFGLVNSDIQLLALDMETIKETVHDTILYSHRLEMPKIEVYFHGIDAFFMNAKALKEIGSRTTNFLLGAPFWDYYVYAYFLSSDFNISQSHPPFCCHVSHEIKWKGWLWNFFYPEFRNYFRANYSKMPIVDVAKLNGLITEHIDPVLLVDLFIHIMACQPNLVRVVNNNESEPSKKGDGTLLEVGSDAKSAVIMGSGVSEADLIHRERLAEFTSFGIIDAINVWDGINWYPDYCGCLDEEFNLGQLGDIRRLVERSDEYGIRGFLLRGRLIRALGELGRHSKITNYDLFCRYTQFLNAKGSVTVISCVLGWAALLGYRDIVLMNMNEEHIHDIYDRKTNAHSIISDSKAKSDRAALIRSLSELKPILLHHGVCVINADQNSRIHVFPKCSIEMSGVIFKSSHELYLTLSKPDKKESASPQRRSFLKKFLTPVIPPLKRLKMRMRAANNRTLRYLTRIIPS